ncbi:iron-regulated protein [Alphaproteobacteria bacterium]|nr:iron-regulated protein [Alphaproteobacteria bacterium]
MSIVKLLVFLKFFIIVLFFSYNSSAENNKETDAVAESYVNLVSHYYGEVYIRTNNMHKSINMFLKYPTEENLQNVKNKWIKARKIYGITEAFRFYGGPIDGVNQYGEEGPEGLINAWPLNEAYIDYVMGNDSSGIISNLSYEINAETIIASNMSEDDADVSTGWHAIEFLLWGQDNSIESPGTRKASDYEGSGVIKERRRAYLKEASDLLLEHISWLNTQWLYNGKGRTGFLEKSDPGGAILTGIATLAGFELSSERIATALDSGDPEDEHSCFSDQTHHDIRANFNGIRNIYLGIGLNSKKFSPSISEIVAKKNPALNSAIIKLLEKTSNSIDKITIPFDKMLSEPESGLGRMAAEETVSNLLAIAEKIKLAGNDLSWNVIIAE